MRDIFGRPPRDAGWAETVGGKCFLKLFKAQNLDYIVSSYDVILRARPSFFTTSAVRSCQCLFEYETLQEHSNCRNSDFFLNVINIEVRFQETISVGGKYFEETLVSKSCVEKLFRQNRTDFHKWISFFYFVNQILQYLVIGNAWWRKQHILVLNIYAPGYAILSCKTELIKNKKTEWYFTLPLNFSIQ